MSQTLEFVIDEKGNVRAVWDDALAPLFRDLGATETRRASHVEPTANGRWQADMSPVGGPLLGEHELRANALAEEREWIRDNLGL